MQKQHILDGIRVLDFSQHVAGRSAHRMMTKMSAEVIQLELVSFGEQIRQVGLKINVHSVDFIQQNCGKQSVCVDMKKTRTEK